MKFKIFSSCSFELNTLGSERVKLKIKHLRTKRWSFIGELKNYPLLKNVYQSSEFESLEFRLF